MDPIQRNQSLFNQIDMEISDFIESLPKDIVHATAALDALMVTAGTIGGSLLKDVQKLRHDFLKAPGNKSKIAEDALRIKHELKEL